MATKHTRPSRPGFWEEWSLTTKLLGIMMLLMLLVLSGTSAWVLENLRDSLIEHTDERLISASETLAKQAYQDVFDRTSTEVAPWHVVPANRKWYARLAVQRLILDAARRQQIGVPHGGIFQRREAIPQSSPLQRRQFPEKRIGRRQGAIFHVFVDARCQVGLCHHGVDLVGHLADGAGKVVGLLTGIEGVVRPRGHALEQIAQNRLENISIDESPSRALRQHGWVHRIDAQRSEFFLCVLRCQKSEQLRQQLLLAQAIGIVEKTGGHATSLCSRDPGWITSPCGRLLGASS